MVISCVFWWCFAIYVTIMISVALIPFYIKVDRLSAGYPARIWLSMCACALECEHLFGCVCVCERNVTFLTSKHQDGHIRDLAPI